MKLSEVTVKNYRSIGSQTKFKVEDLTTLVGPNNEGKSNLLRALGLGMNLIERWIDYPNKLSNNTEITGRDAILFLRGGRPSLQRRSEIAHGYSWQDDYPLEKQERSGTHPTTIRLKFKLDQEEIREFRSLTGISNNGELPIEINLSKQSAAFGIVKQGPGAAKHHEKAKEIAKFISEHLSFVYIPAVRTVDQARELANSLARFRIREITGTDEYRELVRQLGELRQKAVDQVGKNLAASAKKYLPSVKNIRVTISDFGRSNSVEDLLIDDGYETSISSKGDGVKSLVTLALIQELARERSKSHSFILAVDEPEAHLHASAVHELQKLFQEISQTQQVILATHNPIFVNRDRIESNILVIRNSATPAKNIGKIREAIGVQPHDNLETAETVVLVEGITDEHVLPLLLSEVNHEYKSDIQSGRVAFKAAKGASKLRTLITREKSTVCRMIVALDNDEAGRDEANRIKKESLLKESNIFLITDKTRGKNSELEDLIKPEIYIQRLSEELGRDLKESHFKNPSKKWSENLKSASRSLGVSLQEGELVDRAKAAVVESIRKSETIVLKETSMENISALAKLIWPEARKGE